MDLLLHIGCEKTGTTSAQNWLHQNEEALRERGIAYSRVFGRPNNRRICFYGLEAGTPDDQLRRDGVTTAEQHAALQTQIAAEFAEEMAEARRAGIRTYVISNEHCHSRLKTPQSVQRTHDLLAPHFQKISVHCFLRPQIDMCLSLASTLSRNGSVIDRGWLDRELRPTNQYYLFDDLLERWSAIYGREAIVPIGFRRTPDTVAYFEQVLGVADLALPRKPASNTALDYRVIAIINAMSKNEKSEDAFEYVLRLFLNELPVEQRLTLDRYSAQAFQQRYMRSNVACCRSWPQIDIHDLRPDWSHYPQEGTIDRLHTADEVGPFIRHILDRMRLENAMEKARRMSMTSEREWQAGRPEAALRACREGLKFATYAARVEGYRKPMEQVITRLEQRLRRWERMPAASRPDAPEEAGADEPADA
jgi:hypothetical protein